MITLVDHIFDPAEALSEFAKDCQGSGGLVSFTGLVRPTSTEGAVSSLYLQVYSPLTERGMEDAAKVARERWPLDGLRIIHRIGNMAPGEAIVFVATAARHRRDAFEATDFLMDYLKTEAIFWKKETHDNGSAWIEPRQQDHSDAERWATHKETSHGRS